MTKLSDVTSPAPAAAHAIRLLQILRAVAPEPLGVSELARRLGHGKASTHRILTTLLEEGCLILNPINKTYSLGPALIALGDAAAGSGDVLEAARTALPGLATQSNLTASAYRLTPDARLVAVASVNSSGPFQINQAVGRTFPLAPPMGTLQFAWSSPAKLQAMLSAASAQGYGSYNEDRDTFVDDVVWARTHGYSWTVSLGGNRKSGLGEVRQWLEDAAPLGIGRNSRKARDFQLLQIERFADIQAQQGEGAQVPAPIFGLAAPVFDAAGQNVLHVAIFGFLSQVPPSRVAALAELATKTTRQITAQIGGREPFPHELAQF
ncbi:MAG: hypothetical protein JWQ97_3202 [Phenylobacterium sp.]|nr:hypothetical protein [Phenylobacterium sp.]